MSSKCKHNWNMLIMDFSKFEGNIAEFCKMKGVSKSQFYKQRRARNMIKNSHNAKGITTFTKIALKEQKNIVLDKQKKFENKETEIISNMEKISQKKSNSINVEIGKANIRLNAEDKATISFFIKELYSLC